jgi:hypothetical protein
MPVANSTTSRDIDRAFADITLHKVLPQSFGSSLQGRSLAEGLLFIYVSEYLERMACDGDCRVDIVFLTEQLQPYQMSMEVPAKKGSVELRYDSCNATGVEGFAAIFTSDRIGNPSITLLRFDEDQEKWMFVPCGDNGVRREGVPPCQHE